MERRRGQEKAANVAISCLHSPEILERGWREIFRTLKISGRKGSGENVFYEDSSADGILRLL